MALAQQLSQVPAAALVRFGAWRRGLGRNWSGQSDDDAPVPARLSPGNSPARALLAGRLLPQICSSDHKGDSQV